MLLTARQAHQAWGNVKTFLGRAHVEGQKWAGTIDGYANLARHVLGASSGLLTELGASRALDAGVKGLSQYDQIRKHVMDTDERARNHLSRIAKAAPEII